MGLVVSLNVAGRLAVLVGGGAVAERKAMALLEAGARVRVVSPELTRGLEALWRQGRIEAVLRAYRSGDLEGACLAVAATGVPPVDEAVVADAKRAGALSNAATAPGLGDLSFTAEVRRGPVTVAISTGGGSPALARRLRQAIEAAVGPEYGSLAALLAEARDQLRSIPGLTQADRAKVLDEIASGPALDLLARGDPGGARAWIKQVLANRRNQQD